MASQFILRRRREVTGVALTLLKHWPEHLERQNPWMRQEIELEAPGRLAVAMADLHRQALLGKERIGLAL